MNKLYGVSDRFAKSFFREEDGVQVIEYALIIAVVAIGLVVALNAITTGTSLNSFMTRLSNCIATGTCA
jgi:pilus assembly protein Flp/PilA